MLWVSLFVGVPPGRATRGDLGRLLLLSRERVAPQSEAIGGPSLPGGQSMLWGAVWWRGQHRRTAQEDSTGGQHRRTAQEDSTGWQSMMWWGAPHLQQPVDLRERGHPHLQPSARALIFD